MFSYVSAWGVLLAALSAMAVGTLWYSPFLFGKPWMKAVGLTDKLMQRRMASSLLALLAVSLITAYILAHFIVFTYAYFGGNPVVVGAVTAFWAWIGFGATGVIAHGIMEPRDRSVLYINAGNRLVTFVVMGLIIGALM